MKKLFFLFPLLLFSLEINVDYFQKSDIKNEITTMYNNFAFLCLKKKNTVLCEFDKIPSTYVFKAKSTFFKFIPYFKNHKFFIKIVCKKKCYLFSGEDNLYMNPLLSLQEKKISKKWIIISPMEIYLSKKKPKGLNFYFKNSPKIFIGAVDENENPIIVSKQSQDVLKYFEILKSFQKGMDVSDEIDDFIRKYPNSVFIPDVLYMKMVLLEKNNDPEDLIEIGKKWIKKYAYDDKLPKVLLLMAKAYSQMGFLSDASYFFNRIITEYPGTNEADLAMIYLADQLYSAGDSKKAMKLYEDVLFSTKNIDIASLAAARLAQRYMDSGNFKKAYEYYKKIYKANKKFLLKDKKKAFDLAKLLASHNMYSLAIDIGEDLIKKLKYTDDMYEPLLYYLAVWNYKAKNYKKSLYYIDLYLKKFPFGDYSDSLKALKDKVLFNLPENDLNAQLKYIDKIIKEYKGSEIALKALVKKAKILEKLKKYKEILAMEDKLNAVPKTLFPEKEKFLNKVKKEYAIWLLNKNKCIDAVEVIKKYHLNLDKKYDDKIYECAMKAMDYGLASVICNKYLDSPDDKIFIKWMKRKIEALKGLGDYKNLVIAIDDLCGVYKKCHKYKLYKFFALWKLGDYKKALEVANSIKEKDIKNTDVYIKIVKWGMENKNYLLAATFAKKIIDLQNEYKVYPYSPFVEFVYAKYTKNKKEAIKVLKEVLKRVKGEEKARALFMLANLTNEKKYLDECLKVKNSKLWKGLCKDAKGLF